MTKNKQNTFTIEHIKSAIQNAISSLNDEDLISFLSKEIYENQHQTLTVQHLQELIGQHLIDFDCCSELKETEDLCESIIEELQKPLQTQETEQPDPYDPQMKHPDGVCLICEREMPLTKHHLIPRTLHKKLYKRGYTERQLQAGIMICRPCHSAIHRFIDEETMGMEYYTLEKLLSHEKVKTWIPYAKKQKPVPKEHAQLYANGLKYKM